MKTEANMSTKEPDLTGVRFNKRRASKDQISVATRLLRQGIPIQDIAKEAEVSIGTIYAIKRRKRIKAPKRPEQTQRPLEPFMKTIVDEVLRRISGRIEIRVKGE